MVTPELGPSGVGWGGRIEAAREAAGLKAKELAAIVGVGAPIVTDWQNGRRCPSAENLVAIARATKQSLAFLLPDAFDGPGSLEALCRDVGAKIGSRRPELLLGMPDRRLQRNLDSLIGTWVAEGGTIPGPKGTKPPRS